jgi:MerR family transcriptional regulator, heat shock protein HspR
LRIYEREGLVTPARSEGGTRRYSRDDIDRLNEVAALMAAGMNIIGVRRVLELEQENRRLQAEVDARPPRPRPRPGPASRT